MTRSEYSGILKTNPWEHSFHRDANQPRLLPPLPESPPKISGNKFGSDLDNARFASSLTVSPSFDVRFFLLLDFDDDLVDAREASIGLPVGKA